MFTKKSRSLSRYVKSQSLFNHCGFLSIFLLCWCSQSFKFFLISVVSATFLSLWYMQPSKQTRWGNFLNIIAELCTIKSRHLAQESAWHNSHSQSLFCILFWVVVSPPKLKLPVTTFEDIVQLNSKCHSACMLNCGCKCVSLSAEVNILYLILSLQRKLRLQVCFAHHYTVQLQSS